MRTSLTTAIITSTLIISSYSFSQTKYDFLSYDGNKIIINPKSVRNADADSLTRYDEFLTNLNSKFLTLRDECQESLPAVENKHERLSDDIQNILCRIGGDGEKCARIKIERNWMGKVTKTTTLGPQFVPMSEQQLFTKVLKEFTANPSSQTLVNKTDRCGQFLSAYFQGFSDKAMRESYQGKISNVCNSLQEAHSCLNDIGTKSVASTDPNLRENEKGLGSDESVFKRTFKGVQR